MSDLPSPDPDLLPVRMLAEFAYCPRLAYQMHHEGRWADNEFTEEGRMVHRRVDEDDEVLPDPGSAGPDDPPSVARSISLASEKLGLVAKLDLVEATDFLAVPVETKRGKLPPTPEQSWEPDRVQLMAQGLLLCEAGYQSTYGVLYYQGSRRRVTVPLDQALEARTRELLDQARGILAGSILPPPLVDSPKCKGCSLAGICLPDETHALHVLGRERAEPGVGVEEIRRFYPARDDALPFYVQEQGAQVGKTSESLRVSKGKATLGEVRLVDVSQVVLCGNIGITAQAIHLCAEAGIPIIHLSMGHWFYAITQGFGLKNAYDRQAQFAAAADPKRCLSLAKAWVWAKGQNQRTLLRRNARDCPDRVLHEMARYLSMVETAINLDQLLGLEGNIAAQYFGQFGLMLKSKSELKVFDWTTRNRRPPRDPVNAMLSFGYALLAKECCVALAAVGLDPFWGFFHQPRHGRPALALDLMEEFRALIVDSAVLTAINTGMVTASDFEVSKSGCLMTASGRKSYIKAYEARLDQLATHPIFDYRCSWRRIIAMQAQLLARHLRGELASYQGIVTR